jgi:pyruvate dehydrogenase E1 component beta subunit
MGMALTGFRPIVELMFSDFIGVCYDQIVNSIAKHRFMQGGTLEVPLVIRAMGGGGTRFGAQHSQTGEGWLLPAPGLKIYAAGTPAQAYHMIRSAVLDPNPVVVLEHKLLFARKGPVQRFEDTVPPIEAPARIRSGDDITIVASLGMVERMLSAGDQLSSRGIAADLYDLRVLRPMRLEPIIESVRRTHRLLVIEENHRPGGWGGEVISTVVSQAFDYLDAPPDHISLPDWPIPYSPALEDAAIPSVNMIVERAAALVTSTKT